MRHVIAPIVEGDCEVKCAQPLIYRIWTELLGQSSLLVLNPSRTKRQLVANIAKGELQRKLDEVCVRLEQKLDKESRGAVLLLMDADNDCPVELAEKLRKAAHLRSRLSLFCVIAKRMFENWIVAGASSLAGISGLPDDFVLPADVEARNGAGWLESQIRRRNPARKYDKIVDSVVFVRQMNLNDARAKSPSFDKLCRDLESWVSATGTPPPP